VTDGFLAALVMGALAGAALAALHLASLWWSVRRAAHTPWPARWVAASALLRIAIVALGLSLVATLGAPALFAAFAAFLLTRSVVLARTRSREAAVAHRDAPWC
jgi:F1F0 ATPase subunit 2